MPMSSLIIGIDLAPIKAIRGVRTIVGDITTQKARQVNAAGLPFSMKYFDSPHQLPCCDAPLALSTSTL